MPEKLTALASILPTVIGAKLKPSAGASGESPLAPGLYKIVLSGSTISLTRVTVR